MTESPSLNQKSPEYKKVNKFYLGFNRETIHLKDF
jgi:hypothetical protein